MTTVRKPKLHNAFNNQGENTMLVNDDFPESEARYLKYCRLGQSQMELPDRRFSSPWVNRSRMRTVRSFARTKQISSFPLRAKFFSQLCPRFLAKKVLAKDRSDLMGSTVQS